MNNTKWDELRCEMLELDPPPGWITANVSGYRSMPDWEWEFHFRQDGYETILHLDILIKDATQRERVRESLRRVHVPGEELPDRFRIFGYLEEGQAADYI